MKLVFLEYLRLSLLNHLKQPLWLTFRKIDESSKLICCRSASLVNIFCVMLLSISQNKCIFVFYLTSIQDYCHLYNKIFGVLYTSSESIILLIVERVRAWSDYQIYFSMSKLHEQYSSVILHKRESLKQKTSFRKMLVSLLKCTGENDVRFILKKCIRKLYKRIVYRKYINFTQTSWKLFCFMSISTRYFLVEFQTRLKKIRS